MRRLRVAAAVGVVIAALVAPAANAATERFVIHGAHVSDADPAQGTLLKATKVNPCGFEVVNRRLLADGTVVGCGPYPDCPYVLHYHGVLFAHPDPAPNGCGWGEVIPFAAESRPVQDLSWSKTYNDEALETRMLRKAERYVLNAIRDDKELKGEVTPAQRPLAISALRHDQSAHNILRKLVKGEVMHTHRAKRRADRLIELSIRPLHRLLDQYPAPPE